MSKQYRINSIVEAIQYNGRNKEEIFDTFGYYSDFLALGDWVIRNQTEQVFTVPNNIFVYLYSEVYE
jgi:hypothetical protein